MQRPLFHCRSSRPLEESSEPVLWSPTYHFFSLLLPVLLATDQNNARSIIVYQKNLDKIAELTSHSAMGVSGPNSDFVEFTEYVDKWRR